MAVWKVTEIHQGRRGSFTEGSERSYTRNFRVHTDSKLDGPVEVFFASAGGESIPALYSPYSAYSGSEYDTLSLCRSITPVQDDDDWTIWHVTCEYSTSSPTGDPRLGQAADGGNPGSGSGASGDPSLEPPVEEWGEWHRDQVQMHEAEFTVFGLDFTSKAFTTTAYEPFDPPPTREAGGITLVVERNEFVYNPLLKSLYSFTTNRDQFIFTDDQNQWLCKPITARRQYKGPLAYWRVRYEFHHCGDLGDWNHHLLNAGFKAFQPQIPGSQVLRLRPILIDAQPPSKPVPLDKEGRILSESDIALGKFHWLIYGKYNSRPFAPLNIQVDP